MGEDNTLGNLMKNMETEYLAKGKECMREFMKITGYEKTFINNEGVNKDEWKQMKHLTEGIEDLWEWSNIHYEDTDKHTNNINEYKQKRDNQVASSEEKMMIEKYEVMRFLNPELCGDDMEAIGENIYTTQLKQFNLINRYLQHKDADILTLIFQNVYTKDSDKVEGYLNQDYYIKIKPSKKWSKDARKTIFKYIQLDKRYKMVFLFC